MKLHDKRTRPVAHHRHRTGHSPDEGRHGAGDRHHHLVRMFPPRRAVSAMLASSDLGLPTDVLDGRWYPRQAYWQRAAELGWIPVNPRPRDEGSAGAGVAGFGEGALATACATGVFTGGEAQRAHERSRVLEPGQVAEFRDAGNGPRELHAAHGLARLDDGRQAPARDVVLAFGLETLEAGVVFGNGPDLLLADPVLGRRRTEDGTEPTQIRWPPSGTACIPDLLAQEHGRALKVAPNPAHPITGHHLCVKVNRYLERVYSPDRLLTPLRRQGPKGSGQFVSISWEEALETITHRCQAIIVRDGAAAILPYCYLGSMGGLSCYGTMHALFHRLGASRLERTICGGQSQGLRGIVGTMMTDPEHLKDARLILAWGINPISTTVHTWSLMRRALQHGARLVVIDPYRSRTAAKADWHVQLYPGTDGALALGLLHVILRDGLEDADYLAQYTTGLAELRSQVDTWTPTRTAQETGVPDAQIVALAHTYATTRPACIRHGVGLQRATGAGMALRLMQCLPVVTGQLRYAAGGIADARSLRMLGLDRLSRPDLGPPAPRTLNMIQLGRHLTDSALQPPISALQEVAASRRP